MGKIVNIGGDRLGSGNKNNIELRNYERSTHDKSRGFISTMSAGTLVPCFTDICLPGDTWDINVDAEVLTGPTVGPLFGSMKVQVDFFYAPMRLYHKALTMNMTGIGMDVAKIKLPQMLLKANRLVYGKNPDNAQINPSSIFKYLGISGLGNDPSNANVTERFFLATFYILYFDVFKVYYANKQEESAFIIHDDLTPLDVTPTSVKWTGGNNGQYVEDINPIGNNSPTNLVTYNAWVKFDFPAGTLTEFDPSLIQFTFEDNGITQTKNGNEVFSDWNFDLANDDVYGNNLIQDGILTHTSVTCKGYIINNTLYDSQPPKLVKFALENIDKVKLEILEHPISSPYVIDETSLEPFNLPFHTTTINNEKVFSATSNQEGLLVKTYQSDINNNWINKAWIDGNGGVGGINNITKIDTSNGYITVDAVNMAKRVYEMLYRIAISDGSIDAWQSATYTYERVKENVNPLYMGGLSKELVFQAVISQSASPNEPLGTLAGRGSLNGKHKGGQITIRPDEIGMIFANVSITPRISYSQGNEWFNNLETFDDFHKSVFDGIGFQNRMTDEMAYFNTTANQAGIVSRVAGKVPAWINYMTDIDRCYGNFAERTQQMFMVLSRKYDTGFSNGGRNSYIKDLTTYIDPSKFNHIFADTRLDAQNYWTQINFDVKVRRIMSAKQIPNL